MYRTKGKRILDISIAAMGLIALLPFFVVLPVLLSVHFKGNPFFAQRRPGLNGRLFTILKFRTMRRDSHPLSWFGSVIRQSSVDELPQLWNVLRGDMSIVGPRPLLAEYLSLYTAEQGKRHMVKPGMTGLAQIHGRNNLTWEEKFMYDLQYVHTVSLTHDVWIIWRTVTGMLLFRNVGSGFETARFKGNPVC